MARDDDWLMGALAAQDAYRGDAPFPAPPPTGIRTGELPRTFEDYLAQAAAPRAVVPIDEPRPPGYTHAPLDPGRERVGAFLRGELLPSRVRQPRDAGPYGTVSGLPGATHYGISPEVEKSAALAGGVMDIGKRMVQAPFEVTNRAIRGGYAPDNQELTEDIWQEIIPNLIGARTLGGGGMRGSLGAAGGGRMIQPTIAREAPGVAEGAAQKTYRGYPKDVSTLGPEDISKYVNEPQRVAYPGVYGNPRIVAAEAAAMTAPEHPALKQLFGVTRDDLWEIGGRGTRPGNMEPRIAAVAKPKGSYASEAIMNPRNAQRMIDTLGEMERYPQLTRGMDAWYVMDPAFQRMVQLVGREQAIKDYNRFNTIVPMFSPGSEVLTEINRGTAANMMAARGEFPIFARYAGMAADKRGADFPEALRDVVGHMYHPTAHAGPVQNYLERGIVDMTQPKVPLYMQASGVPETGFQTKLPVPDAHFTRGSGMSDVRKNAKPGASMKTPEYAAYGPWYRENVAKPLGIEAVPAQGRMWAGYAPQTGVTTPIGAPKLELLAQRIVERAQQLGIDPRQLRDDVLLGRAHANWLAAPGVGGALGMGALADQSRYQPYD